MDALVYCSSCRALALAPLVDKGLIWFTNRFRFASRGKVIFCFGLKKYWFCECCHDMNSLVSSLSTSYQNLILCSGICKIQVCKAMQSLKDRVARCLCVGLYHPDFVLSVQQAFGFLVGIAVLLAIAVFFVITILWAWGHLLELMAPPTVSTLFNWSGQSMVEFNGKLQATHEDDVQSAGGTLPSCCSIQLQSHYHNFQCSLCTWSTSMYDMFGPTVWARGPAVLVYLVQYTR